MTEYNLRQPLSPAEYDQRRRMLERRFPQLSCTSGVRSVAHNEQVGGRAGSKHLIGMANDYSGPTYLVKQALGYAISIGLWGLTHDVGSGEHLHIQGLPPGAIADWWLEQWG